jgi:dCTP diphosphatase
MEETELASLAAALRDFARRRDWDQFHSPKNLAAALIVEAAELLEVFQWMKEEDSRQLSPQDLGRVREEVADILIYLVRFSDILGIDLLAAVQDKIKRNDAKYPAEVVKGRSDKYTRYET